MVSNDEVTKKRLETFQENVNRKTLIDWVRITGLANPGKRKIDRLLEDFSRDILKYPTEHPSPFSWPTTAGYSGSCMAIRARMSYQFWKFFMMEGRKTLYEYNRKNGTDIKINREKTITLQDQDRLGLFIRKYIRTEYDKVNKKPVDITLRKGYLKIGEHTPVKPAIAAVLLDVNLSEWSGIPLEKMLTDSEKSAIERGEIKRGSMVLPDLISDSEEASILKENQNTENNQASSSAPSDVAQTNQSQSTTKKRGLSENVGEQEEPAHKKCFRK